MNELWKDIEGYEGLYQISSFGNVRSLINNIILKPFPDKRKKYRKVVLNKNGERKIFRVARLVAKHFIPNPLNKEQVNHIDNDSENDNVSNLEWVTNLENRIHRKLYSKKHQKYFGVAFKKIADEIIVNKNAVYKVPGYNEELHENFIFKVKPFTSHEIKRRLQHIANGFPLDDFITKGDS